MRLGEYAELAHEGREDCLRAEVLEETVVFKEHPERALSCRQCPEGLKHCIQEAVLRAVGVAEAEFNLTRGRRHVAGLASRDEGELIP